MKLYRRVVPPKPDAVRVPEDDELELDLRNRFILAYK